MTVSTSVVARRYVDVVADQVIAVDYPAYEESDIKVLYGNAVVEAIQNVDYTVALAGDFETFTITVSSSLITKINDLIAADATEVNAITVRREMDYLTDATPAGVRRTDFTSREFDRVALRDQQIDDQQARGVRLAKTFAAPYPDIEIKQMPADVSDEPALVFKSSGGVGAGPTTLDLQNAGANATAAATSEANAAASAAAAASSAALLNPFGVVSITANETIGEARRNKLLRTDQRRSFTLPIPTTLGNGFSFQVDGGGAELVREVGTTLTMIGSTITVGVGAEIKPGQVATVFTDGTDWFVYLTSRQHFEHVSVSSFGPTQPFLDFDVPFQCKGFRYKFVRFAPTVDAAFLGLQIGDSGGLEVGATSYYTMVNDLLTGVGGSTLINMFTLSTQCNVPVATLGDEAWGEGQVSGFWDEHGPHLSGTRGGVIAGPTNAGGSLLGRMNPGGTRNNANKIRFIPTAGAIDSIDLYIEWDL